MHELYRVYLHSTRDYVHRRADDGYTRCDKSTLIVYYLWSEDRTPGAVVACLKYKKTRFNETSKVLLAARFVSSILLSA